MLAQRSPTIFKLHLIGLNWRCQMRLKFNLTSAPTALFLIIAINIELQYLVFEHASFE